MNTVVPLSRDSERLEAASRWVLKIDDGVLSASDEAAFGLWMDENPNNRDVLLEVASVWDKTDTLARLADFFPHEVTINQPQPAPCQVPIIPQYKQLNIVLPRPITPL